METIICAICVYFTALKGSEYVLNKLFSKEENENEKTNC